MVLGKRTVTTYRTSAPRRYTKKSKYATKARGTRANFLPSSLTAAAPRRVELKRVDYFINQEFKDPSIGICELVNGIAVGDDVFNREGRQVQFKGIEVQGSILAPLQTTAASFPQDIIRVMVVYDASPNGGSTPPVSDILRDIAQAGGAYTIGQSHQNVNNYARYHIMYDKILNAPAWNLGNTNFQHDFSYVLDRKFPVNKMMTFTGTGGTVASISKGAIYMLCVATNGMPLTPGYGWQFAGTVRSYFTDV